jgi:hypothetical protein
MLNATFHFIRTNEPDEVLKIFKIDDDTFRCVFQPGDIRASYSFRLTRYVLLRYLTTTLQAVINDDVDPYEQVQLSTMIHPRILFHVIDLEKEETFDRLWLMLVNSLDYDIVKNGLSSNQRSRLNAHSQRVQTPQRYFSGPNPEDTDS